MQDSYGNENYSIVSGRWGNRPLPAEPIAITNASYDYVDSQTLIENNKSRRPPTPPPKPCRNKFVPAWEQPVIFKHHRHMRVDVNIH